MECKCLQARREAAGATGDVQTASHRGGVDSFRRVAKTAAHKPIRAGGGIAQTTADAGLFSGTGVVFATRDRSPVPRGAVVLSATDRRGKAEGFVVPSADHG